MRERESLTLVEMTKKDTGAKPENKESRSFRSSAMREPLFGSYTEEEGEKK